MADAPEYVWLLHVDAETEMTKRGDYTTPAKRLLRAGELRDRFAWLTQRDAAFFPAELPQSVGKIAPFALPFAATPSAQRLAIRKGYRFPLCPKREVLERVLSRELLAQSDLPAPPLRTFVRSASELASILSRDHTQAPLRTKRAYGSRGSGQRVMRKALSEDDQRYLADGLRLGGLVVETEVSVQRELSIHGMILRGGDTYLGTACKLTVDKFGAPECIEPTPQVDQPRISELGTQAAELLRNAGYFGPFGLDLLEDEQGSLLPSDLNARFTLGFSIGLGPKRDEAIAAYLAQ